MTFLAQGSRRGKACKFCQETDHGPDVCALASCKTSLGETAGGEKKPASRDGWSWRPKAERVCTLGMRADVCTTPIVGSSMSVRTWVAKVTIGRWSVAARAASGRASPGRRPSQIKTDSPLWEQTVVTRKLVGLY